MSKVTNDTGSLFKTYGSIIWLLCGITTGSILGLVLEDVEVIKPLGDIF
jgi:Na+/H+-dicarboxylate symporter